MKIGVLGSGDVAQVLGGGFVGRGDDVMLGSRERGNAKTQAWVAKHAPRGSNGTFADAARFGELLVLATLGTATEEAIRSAGIANFDGKVVIDATNPLVFAEHAPPALSVGWHDSQGELVQRLLPKARVVKAFNTVGNQLMIKPQLPGGPPDMFICGDDADAKRIVTGILRDFGWPAIDIGDITGARVLEPLCVLWVLYGIRTGTWNHAFKLLRG
jgi:8-hydroxy-5-deazaflavin:NADPH oxidoreductase